MQLACKTDKQIQCTVALLNSFRYSRRNNWKSNWKLWGEAQLFFVFFFGISLDSRYCKKRRKTPVTCIWSQVAKMQFSLRVFFLFFCFFGFSFFEWFCTKMHIHAYKYRQKWMSTEKSLKPETDLSSLAHRDTVNCCFSWCYVAVTAGPTPRETSYSSC